MNCPVGGQHPASFQQKAAPIRQMFQNLKRHHQIERSGRMGKRGAGSLLEDQVRKLVMRAGEIHRLRRAVQSHYAVRRAGQFRRTVTRAASRVQHAFAAGQPRGEEIARHVLVEQIRLDLPRDGAFAGKLSHKVPPAAGCTSTRHGRCTYPKTGPEERSICNVRALSIQSQIAAPSVRNGENEKDAG